MYNAVQNYYIFFFLRFYILADICKSDSFKVSDTGNYNIDDFFDGEYLADHELVNGHKCYRKTTDQNGLIVFETDIFGNTGWVMKDDVKTTFYR